MTPAQAFALVREKTKAAHPEPEKGTVDDLLKLRAMKGR
jgi:hypothetical protein